MQSKIGTLSAMLNPLGSRSKNQPITSLYKWSFNFSFLFSLLLNLLYFTLQFQYIDVNYLQTFTIHSILFSINTYVRQCQSQLRCQYINNKCSRMTYISTYTFSLQDADGCVGYLACIIQNNYGRMGATATIC